MPAPTTADVAIVGASHVGMALALALARLGGPELAITLIDRGTAERPEADPRAFAISAGSRRLLAAIGAWDRISGATEPVRSIEITDSALEHAIRPVLLAWENSIDGEPASWIVEAARLEAALAEAVAATASIARIESAEVTGLERGAVLARVMLAGGGEVDAPLVVAADGARSRLRGLAGIGVVAWGYEQTGIVATVAHERPHDGKAVQHFLPAGPFALLPLPGNRSAVTWSEGAEEARRVLALDDAAFLAEVDLRAGGRLGGLALAGPRGGWPLAYQSARALAGPRLALAGDAARSVHPIAGQGLNLGLRDAAALAECVTDAVRVGLDAGDASALERYERWRRFDSFGWGAGFDALNRLFSVDSTLLRAVRGAGLGIVDRLPGLKALLVAEAAGSTGEPPRLMRG